MEKRVERSELKGALRPEALEAPESGIFEVIAHARGHHDVLPLWAGEGDLPTPRFIADAADSVFPDLRRGISLLSVRQLDPDIGGSHAEHLRFRLQEEIRLAYTAMATSASISTAMLKGRPARPTAERACRPI